jgi:hypothetical protein
MRRVLVVLGAMGLVAALAAPAQAATVIGETTPVTNPATTCSPSNNYGQVQLSTAGPPTYTVPFDGTITSFTAGGGVGGQTKLLVMQPVSGTTFNVVAKSDFGTFTTTGVQTFPAQIPVHAGQVIGQYGVVCATPGDPGDSFGYFTGSEPAIGVDQAFSTPSGPAARINISATVDTGTTPPPVTPSGPTGQRAKALKKCKKKHSKKARKKCRKKAKKLPV